MVTEAEKERLIRDADWMVVPSRFESFGIVAIEAMREGTPVIATRGSGIEEVATLTPTTLFAQPGDRHTLCMAIKQALALGPCYTETVAPSIRQVFASHFTADKMIRATESVYLGLCDGLQAPTSARSAPASR
jgi:glycogen(starch) synthase